MNRVLAFFAIYTIALAACASDGAVPTTATTTTALPTATIGTVPECRQETVTFEIAGLTIEATRCPGGPDWVILAHDFGSTRASWGDFPLAVQDAGYTVLAYDNRGHGGSDCPREVMSLFEDAVAAAAYARNAGAETIVFGGASANAGVGLYLAADENLAGVFALSTMLDSPCAPDVESRIPLIDEPMLLVAAEDDGDAAEIALLLGASSEDAETIVVETGGNGTTMLDLDPALTEEIIDWILGL